MRSIPRPSALKIKAMARRTAKEIENDIFKVVSNIVLRDGLSAVSIKQVAKESRTDVSVLTRRFTDDNGLIKAYTSKFDYFINDVLCRIDMSSCSVIEYFHRMATNLVTNLYQNKEMQEVMLWELRVNNKLTRKSARSRENTLQEIMPNISSKIRLDMGVDPRALLAVLVGGLYYLILRGNRSTFCGIEWNSKKGRELLINSLTDIIEKFLVKE